MHPPASPIQVQDMLAYVPHFDCVAICAHEAGRVRHTPASHSHADCSIQRSWTNAMSQFVGRVTHWLASDDQLQLTAGLSALAVGQRAAPVAIVVNVLHATDVALRHCANPSCQRQLRPQVVRALVHLVAAFERLVIALHCVGRLMHALFSHAHERVETSHVAWCAICEHELGG